MAKNITGTLKYLESGQLVTDWGEGNFLALKFTNNNPDKIKTIKVGLDPSQGSGLVPLDEDMNGVFKITNQEAQKFVVESYDEEDKLLSRDEYDLSGLWCKIKEIKLDITSEVESSYVRGAVIPVSFEYDLKDVVEPENAVIKIGYRDDYFDTFIENITPETASGTITKSVNTNDLVGAYSTEIVVEVFNTDGTMSYARDNTDTFEITEPTGPRITLTDTDPIEIEENDGTWALYELTDFDADTMEVLGESSDENVFTIAPEYSHEGRLYLSATFGTMEGATATLTAKIVDKTTHEVLASDSKGVLIIAVHPEPYFGFESEDISDNMTYAYNYCENGVEGHVIGYAGATVEDLDNVTINTTPANTPLNFTKSYVDPELRDDVLITISGVNNTSDDITVEIGLDQGGVETFVTFTIEGQPAQPTIVSDDFEAGVTYSNQYFVAPRTFTVANKPAGSTLTISYDHGGFTLSGDDTGYTISGVNVETELATIQFLLDGVSFAEVYVAGKASP